MAEAVLAVQAVGSVVQGFQGWQAGKTQAKEMGIQADAARKEGLLAEGQARRAAARYRAAQNAKISGAGVNTAGSMLDVLAETAKQQDMDALAIRYGADTKVRAFQSGKAIANKEAGNALFSGLVGAAKAGGDYYTTKTLLQGGSSWKVPAGERVFSGPSVGR